MIWSWLEPLQQQSQIHFLDRHLAEFLIEKSGLSDETTRSRFAYLITTLSIEVREGHVCLDLNLFHKKLTENVIWSLLAYPTIEDWHTIVNLAKQNNIISDGSFNTPLVHSEDRLYFQRMWLDEQNIATFFKDNHAITADIRVILNQFFEYDKSAIDWQKIAVALALTRKIAVISGGPGTGKTTTVAKLLSCLLMLQPKARIITAAPTGKAASRLSESLKLSIESLQLTSFNLPTDAITLHRLLGAKRTSSEFNYHKHNKLNLDVLVIDEASMVDLNMMARVIEALPDNARLILLGDKDQLSSVEAGAIFGDLCEFIRLGYSQERAQQLQELTGYKVPSNQPNETIADSICLLQKSYRFSYLSGIGQLANAIKEDQINTVIGLLKEQPFPDVRFYPLEDQANYLDAITKSVAYYKVYLKAINTQGELDIETIIKTFATYRLLCALRDGPFGVKQLNQAIESHLLHKKLIHLKSSEAWYVGRPVMIIQNNSALGLYNGDIGIALPSKHDTNKLRVYFIFADGSIKGFSPSRLPEHETAYAMTVHKSQGSEFEHVSVILPTDKTQLISRSLLYTAVTRAKKTVTIYATEKIIKQAVNSQEKRQSGLVSLLKS